MDESGHVGAHDKPTGLWWKGCARPGAHVRKDLFRLSLNVDACTPLLVCAGSGASETERETHRGRETEGERGSPWRSQTSQVSLLLRFVPSFYNILISMCPLCASSQHEWTELVVSAAMFPLFSTRRCVDVQFLPPLAVRRPSTAKMCSLKRDAQALQTYFHLLVFFPRSCRVSTCSAWLHHRTIR